MEQAKKEAQPQKSDHAGAADKSLVHRVCEACNNMFAVPADSPERRCHNCRKE